MEPSFLVLTDWALRSQRAVYLAAIPPLEPELGLVTIPEQYYWQERRDTLAALARPRTLCSSIFNLGVAQQPGARIAAPHRCEFNS